MKKILIVSILMLIAISLVFLYETGADTDTDPLKDPQNIGRALIGTWKFSKNGIDTILKFEPSGPLMAASSRPGGDLDHGTGPKNYANGRMTGVSINTQKKLKFTFSAFWRIENGKVKFKEFSKWKRVPMDGAMMRGTDGEGGIIPVGMNNASDARCGAITLYDDGYGGIVPIDASCSCAHLFDNADRAYTCQNSPGQTKVCQDLEETGLNLQRQAFKRRTPEEREIAYNTIWANTPEALRPKKEAFPIDDKVCAELNPTMPDGTPLSKQDGAPPIVYDPRDFSSVSYTVNFKVNSEFVAYDTYDSDYTGKKPAKCKGSGKLPMSKCSISGNIDVTVPRRNGDNKIETEAWGKFNCSSESCKYWTYRRLSGGSMLLNVHGASASGDVAMLVRIDGKVFNHGDINITNFRVVKINSVKATSPYIKQHCYEDVGKMLFMVTPSKEHPDGKKIVSYKPAKQCWHTYRLNCKFLETLQKFSISKGMHLYPGPRRPWDKGYAFPGGEIQFDPSKTK